MKKIFEVHWAIKGFNEVEAETKEQAVKIVRGMNDKELDLMTISLSFDEVVEIGEVR